jgi:hypothetical protein
MVLPQEIQGDPCEPAQRQPRQVTHGNAQALALEAGDEGQQRTGDDEAGCRHGHGGHFHHGHLDGKEGDAPEQGERDSEEKAET